MNLRGIVEHGHGLVQLAGLGNGTTLQFIVVQVSRTLLSSTQERKYSGPDHGVH